MFTLTVDGILADFNKKLDQLQRVAQKHNDKASDLRVAAETAREVADDLDKDAEAQAAESFRALAVAGKIRALIS